MKISRRGALQLVAAGISAARFLGGGQSATVPAIAPGPFRGTRDSLGEYRAPEWFRDAKFGIWAHWGPQSAAEYGDWYARNMYIEGHKQYKYHVQQLRPPLQVRLQGHHPDLEGREVRPGTSDVLYQKAGAKYFVSMGVHHDNFDLWNSKHNRWNAVQAWGRRKTSSASSGRPLSRARHEVRRKRAPRGQLSLVPDQPRRRQGRPVQGRSVRRSGPEVRGPLPRDSCGPREFLGPIGGAAQMEAALLSAHQGSDRSATSPTCSTPTARSSSRNGG